MRTKKTAMVTANQNNVTKRISLEKKNLCAHYSALFVVSVMYFHPAPHSRIAGRFGGGASTERLVPLVKHPSLKRAWPQLELIRPFSSHTFCSDFCRHPLSLALLCDVNAAVSPCHFAARNGESAEGWNWPQSELVRRLAKLRRLGSLLSEKT